jgi:NADPH:quinone reductase-like Zn-dependent oxidoreductase
MGLGNDFAGTLTVLGDNVDAFKIGDRVYGVKPPSPLCFNDGIGVAKTGKPIEIRRVFARPYGLPASPGVTL